jgi:opacity protein-like surface antigen
VVAELVLTTAQKQTVYANGSEIGSFKHLPPSLLLHYHFTDQQGIKPYVGAGITYTHFSDEVATGGQFGQSQLGFGVSSRTGHPIGSPLVHQPGCEEGLHPKRCLCLGQQHRSIEGRPHVVCGRLGLPVLSASEAALATEPMA